MGERLTPSDVEKIEISYRGRDDNYFDYTDKNTINVIYAILENLETQTVSKSFSPLEYEEIYTTLDENKKGILNLDSTSKGVVFQPFDLIKEKEETKDELSE